jgi:4-oxalomesaconate tautomerase
MYKRLFRTVFFGLLVMVACKTNRQPQIHRNIGSADRAQIAYAPPNAIPCIFMRAGTSRGPFFDMRDLPQNIEARNRILLKIMGSPDPRQIDGLGGTESVTSKVVMVQPSTRPGIDVDYLFAQVDIENPVVDTTPPCGNMMAGVGCFAIERGMVKSTIPETRVMVYNINTNSVIEEIIQTPNGVVEYNGTARIDGVPGTAAPVVMNLFDQVGGKTGKLLPTQKKREQIQGVEVSLLDAGIPMVLMKATDLGMDGAEPADFFENNPALMSKIEKIRIEAGERMGLGDVRESVLPKVGLLSKPLKEGHNIKSQYLTPHALHPAHAVTGAICVGTALKIKGTVAADVGVSSGTATETIVIEHPSGVIEVRLEMENIGETANVKKAGTIRTVRKIMEGYVFY